MDAKARAGLEEAMQRTPILAEVPRKAVEELAAQGNLHSYRRGTYLFHQGDPAPDVHFLHAGRVEISSTSSTGHRQLHTTLEPPQLFGELGVLGDIPRTSSALAVEEAAVLSIPAEAFRDFLADRPGASLALLRALARQVQAHESLIDDLLFLDLKGRVAKRLLGLVSPSLDEPPPNGSVVPSIVTHADLASLSGGSRENVTRILSELQRRNVVRREGKRYVLEDVRALRRLAGMSG